MKGAAIKAEYQIADRQDSRALATFRSGATDLVDGDTNGVNDIFVFDRQTGTTVRVSVSSAGDEATAKSDRPAISGDGRR